MNILHLSDIHFGRNHYNIPDPFDKKDEILESLITVLSDLQASMRPDLILVTGDIAWYGKSSEYDEAYQWFQELLNRLDMEGDHIVFCPGNHDVNRGAAIDFKEEDLLNSDNKLDIGKCDWYYQYENAHLLEARFFNYNLFCEKMGMQPYTYRLEDGRVEYSYLIGTSDFQFAGHKYCIACFNTAWLPYGNVLKDDQMFLGLPQIERLRDDGKLYDSGTGARDDIFRIGLFHHADRFLHPNEQCEYDGRKAPLPLLLQSVNLALCGHTETGGMPVIRAYQDGGSLLTGGAAYYNDEHPNSFSMIHIDEDTMGLEVCSFYYNGSHWQTFRDIGQYHWRRRKGFLKWEKAISEYTKYSLTVQIDDNKYSVCKGYFDVKKRYVDGREVIDFTNKINPARYIDIETEDDQDQNGRKTQMLAVRHAPGQWQMIAARRMIAEFNYFVASHIQGAACKLVGLADNTGKILYGFPLDESRIQKISDNSNIRWYKLLQELETYYDVRFLHTYPQMPSELEIQAVNWLIELKRMGNLCIGMEIQESFFIVHNLQEIEWVRDVSLKDGGIVFHFVRKMEYHLFGTVISLGECDIYYKSFKVKDMANLLHKIDTWEEGDMRRIDTLAPEWMEWWLIPRNSETKVDTINLEGMYVVQLPKEAPLSMQDNMKNYIVECR